MEELWHAYVGFWNWKTLIPVAFIISTVIAFIYYAVKEKFETSSCIGLAVLPLVYGVILLFRLCGNIPASVFAFWDWGQGQTDDLPWWMVLLMFVSTLGGISLLLLVRRGIRRKTTVIYQVVYRVLRVQDPGILGCLGCLIFSLGFVPIFGICVFIYIAIVFFIFISFPLIIKYFLGYVIYDILLFSVPWSVTVLLQRRRTDRAWIASFVFLFSAALFQMWRFARILGEYNTTVRDFFALHHVSFFISFSILGFALAVYYLRAFSKSGELDANDIRLPWLFFAALANAASIIPFIMGYYSLLGLTIFVLLNTLIGGVILVGRYQILRYSRR